MKKREDVRRKVTAANETLFVVNFDPDQCRERDLERHFGEYGRLRRVQVWLALALCLLGGARVALWGVRAPASCGVICHASHSWEYGCLRSVQVRPSFGACAHASRLSCVQHGS